MGNHEKLNFLGNFGQLVENPTYEMEGRLFEGGGGGLIEDLRYLSLEAADIP